MSKDKTGYTKEKWEAVLDGVNSFIQTQGGKYLVGCLNLAGKGAKPKEAEANINLMAAAPEMFEALLEMMRGFEEGVDHAEYHPAYRQAKDALLKAQGKLNIKEPTTYQQKQRPEWVSGEREE